MGAEILLPCFYKDLTREIKNLTKDKKVLGIKDITTKLVDFLMSDSYIYLRKMFEEERKKNNKANDSIIIKILFIICDYFEKFL